MSSARVSFLHAFIHLFDGALDVEAETTEFVEGIVTWEGEEDHQRIRWHCTPDNVPSPDCKTLVAFLSSGRLIDNDEIAVPRDALFGKFARTTGEFWHRPRFDRTLEELLTIRVAMVDDGEENDAFFVHE